MNEHDRTMWMVASGWFFAIGVFTLTACAVPHRATPWIPFELSENKITLPVKIQGKELRATLDSGSTGALISKKAAEGIFLMRRGSAKVKTVSRRGAFLSYAVDVPMDLEGTTLVLPELIIVEEQGQGTLIRHDLILDNYLFREAVLELDYPRRQLRLHNAGFRYQGQGSTLDLREVNGLLYTTIEVDGRAVEALVDTGNAVETLVCEKDQRPEQKDRLIPRKAIDGIGREVQGVTWVATEVSVGKYVFEDVPVTYLDGCRSNIGYQILSQFDRVIFDLKDHKIHFEKLPARGVNWRSQKSLLEEEGM